ncbi:hypothetical protein COCSUDRAFT_56612 [Coccomyxa subellipsoidea C-169]|uniref:BHLH domain-containing protein n=1 Tax=Coccomyxa subellipsoidea (strain C-169) TaxID=574566 RepID=I0YSM3_COCSC|nr:hypothetical protein COCSUDRAFT_56612 [Coccomyxa subellipsoidea C-169]EIE21392.1 hypothetical protein COCSUDRAFT_56612 [Coccomyxa subellipsoidea C-169]|eukprot:XP_005645936.1 hypothetical protein COCSUDRAFT_56612 [Coccomyxa subellipsoidea C-169]
MEVSPPNVAEALANDSLFDYVFSKSELDDVLQFMERQQDEPVANHSSNVFLGNAPPASVSLQFQPHPSGGFSGNPFTSLGLDQGLNGAQPYLSQIESDPFSSQAMGQPDSLGFDLGMQLDPELNPLHQGNISLGPQSRIKAEPMCGLEPAGLRSPLEGSASPSPNHAGSLGPADSLPSAAGAPLKSEAQPLSAAFAKLGSGGLTSPAGRPRQFSSELHPGSGTKQHTSHSTVEKNRRDRINSLIDELRDLVPPQQKESANTSQDNLDPTKRPKHVVLSDTILLVKSLADKVHATEKALARAQSGGGKEDSQHSQENGAQDLLRRSLPEGTAFNSDTASSSGPSQDLPSVPKGAPMSSGVVVERSNGCLLVKVNCKDRRGLLADVISALKSFPLEITTAAVTTTADGFVCDVFQVKAPSGQEYSEEEIQCHVHFALYPSSTREPQLGDKRQRMRDE